MLGAPAEALADDPPEDIPAVGAYVELVPTATGFRQAGRGQHRSGVPLSRSARRALERAGGVDGKLLTQLATSPELGAPSERLRPPRRQRAAGIDEDGTSLSLGRSLGEVGRTVAGGSDDRLLLLLGLMAGVTAVAAGAAARRGRAS
jgi:hypothetical protein